MQYLNLKLGMDIAVKSLKRADLPPFVLASAPQPMQPAPKRKPEAAAYGPKKQSRTEAPSTGLWIFSFILWIKPYQKI